LLSELRVPFLNPYSQSSTIVSIWHCSPPKLRSKVIRGMRPASSLGATMACSIRRRWEGAFADLVLYWGTMLLKFDRESYT
jgi:hypothetical protein